MDDDTLIARFEAGELKPEEFHHAQHVRVAWCYVRRHPLPDALARFAAGLQRFAASIGKATLYHETITVAFVLLIRERFDDEESRESWETFAARNPDLLQWKPSVLDRYYHPETLQSERARRTFVMPDRLADGAR